MSTPERDLIVGGQAVIEGVMMRTPNAYAIAVRKADGTIVNTAARLLTNTPDLAEHFEAVARNVDLAPVSMVPAHRNLLKP